MLNTGEIVINVTKFNIKLLQKELRGKVTHLVKQNLNHFRYRVYLCSNTLHLNSVFTGTHSLLKLLKKNN